MLFFDNAEKRQQKVDDIMHYVNKEIAPSPAYVELHNKELLSFIFDINYTDRLVTVEFQGKLASEMNKYGFNFNVTNNQLQDYTQGIIKQIERVRESYLKDEKESQKGYFEALCRRIKYSLAYQIIRNNPKIANIYMDYEDIGIQFTLRRLRVEIFPKFMWAEGTIYIFYEDDSIAEQKMKLEKLTSNLTKLKVDYDKQEPVAKSEPTDKDVYLDKQDRLAVYDKHTNELLYEHKPEDALIDLMTDSLVEWLQSLPKKDLYTFAKKQGVITNWGDNLNRYTNRHGYTLIHEYFVDGVYGIYRNTGAEQPIIDYVTNLLVNEYKAHPNNFMRVYKHLFC